MKQERQGALIVFEGIDGTGKSTQLKLLADYLVGQGYNVVTTREPTDSVYGQKIRQLYMNRELCTREEELDLFISDRKEHVKNLLIPSLERGAVILCDRYYLSTAAYQGANGFDPAAIIEMNSFAPLPDIAFIFEQPVETSLRRITDGRGETLNDFEQSESLARVSSIFKALHFPFIKRINADRSIDEVHEEVREAVASLLKIPVAVAVRN